MKKKKCYVSFLALLLSTFSFLHGSHHYHPRAAGRLPKEHEKPFPIITPNAEPLEKDDLDLFFTADFIYWTTRIDGLGYVMSNFGTGTPNPGKGIIEHPNWDFDPGFKAGFGVNFAYDGWDIHALYTWLRSKDIKRQAKTLPASLADYYPTWNIGAQFNNPTVGQITAARTKFDQYFNVIDLELGRNYYISQYLTLRPHIGFKGSWQKFDYEVVYINNNNVMFKMENDQDYWGIGIRTGLDTAWQFGWGFSLYGDFAISALWSLFEIDRKDSRIETILIHAENGDHSIKPVIELGVGLRWETWFSNDDYHLAIQAGWEEQVWMSHNQLIHYFEESAHGDMILQGLTVEVRFDL